MATGHVAMQGIAPRHSPKTRLVQQHFLPKPLKGQGPSRKQPSATVLVQPAEAAVSP